MRQAHYEERRLDRLATVKAAYNEADGGMTERSSSSLQLGDGQSPEDRRKAATAGCDAFVPKPVRREELYRVIDEQLAERGN